MTDSPEIVELQDQLQKELLDRCKPAGLEQLAASLIGTLLGVQIASAKPGFQHGADAGPAGSMGRRFRIECKHYRDATTLSDRELLGEIDQALDRDSALEAWILVATSAVSEQTAQTLSNKAERIGVPVLIVDWRHDRAASFAALCTIDPAVVAIHVSPRAGGLAALLTSALTDRLALLRRELSTWFPGFESLRRRSHDHVRKIWTERDFSVAHLAQDAAGGARPNRVRRRIVHEKLRALWPEVASSNGVMAVIGSEGVGKTWAVMDWLTETINTQPIVICVPASAVTPSRKAHGFLGHGVPRRACSGVDPNWRCRTLDPTA